jgi:hypothetical protein
MPRWLRSWTSQLDRANACPCRTRHRPPAACARPAQVRHPALSDVRQWPCAGRPSAASRAFWCVASSGIAHPQVAVTSDRIFVARLLGLFGCLCSRVFARRARRHSSAEAAPAFCEPSLLSTRCSRSRHSGWGDPRCGACHARRHTCRSCTHAPQRFGRQPRRSPYTLHVHHLATGSCASPGLLQGPAKTGQSDMQSDESGQTP